MNWIDYGNYLEINPPKEFSFEECLIFLGRSDLEVLHQISEGYLYKLIRVKESLILSKISFRDQVIKVEYPIDVPSRLQREKTAHYICEWLDLGQDLELFYQTANQDRVLKDLVRNYYGLRLICIPDLFEALVWAIMGQQINLTFAYTLKKRFVEQYGEGLVFEDKAFWTFPSCEKIAAIDIDDLKQLQFTGRKAEYIINIAKIMAKGELTKELLLKQNGTQQVKKTLTSIRGIGPWTADYVMMKCLHDTTAFPIADVGLHNALKKWLELNRKPTIEELTAYAADWEGWQAYAVFYLWRSLYDKNV
ncbi:DNA-3-methyladenine glycosylase family protein [Bacillus mesophilum]|uniref:DNA-3-methyladenine glycosylase II n=1 Tax=Bacillus mesophilum TaxID=1071718 RepID=A0A7V7RIS0_9BACI|nr:DNA-3-methyladenine glycosylase [Bacillus mesophilum]KAB2330340.1 DNA-3-methyladenine glycosylase 2 family protein [Bacillus mesophilum]